MQPGYTLNLGVQPLRILFYDIETAPGQAFVWSAKTRYIPHTMMIHPPFMLCWAAKWSDNRTVMSSYSTPEEEIREKDDERIVTELADLLRQADIIVAHNGDRFDLYPWSTIEYSSTIWNHWALSKQLTRTSSHEETCDSCITS